VQSGKVWDREKRISNIELRNVEFRREAGETPAVRRGFGLTIFYFRFSIEVEWRMCLSNVEGKPVRRRRYGGVLVWD